jgi:hypothetical protein
MSRRLPDTLLENAASDIKIDIKCESRSLDLIYDSSDSFFMIHPFL